MFTLIFAAVGVAELGVGWWLGHRVLPRRLRATRTAAEAAGTVTGLSLVMVTLPMTPALLGLVTYMTGDRLGLTALCTLSLIGHWLVRPRLEEWQAMVRERGP